jgi:1-acyl-sn-glycerol-3-phosphate acyltransferase
MGWISETDPSSPHPGAFDPEVVALFERFLAPVVRQMWPSSFSGLEHVPTHDRFLVVANHSGMGVAELWALVLAWKERFGVERPVAGMAHPAAFRVPPLRYVLRSVGAVEATRRGAEAARRKGVPLLLFPGGDHEAGRPLWHADRVDFGGRKGWIRLARDLGLSIVPLAITGSHVTLPIVLGASKTISWLIGTRLLGVHRAPLPLLSAVAAPTIFMLARAAGLSRTWSAAAGWASISSTLLLPWIPSRIGFRFLPPIDAEQIQDPARDDTIYDLVVGRIGNELRRGRAANSGFSTAGGMEG